MPNAILRLCCNVCGSEFKKDDIVWYESNLKIILCDQGFKATSTAGPCMTKLLKALDAKGSSMKLNLRTITPRSAKLNS